MSLQYVRYDYWAFGYAVGDATPVDADAALAAEAAVEGAGLRVRDSGGAVDGSASVAANALRMQTGAGAVTGEAAAQAEAVRVLSALAQVAADAGLTAVAAKVYQAQAAIGADAELAAEVSALFAGYGALSGSAALVAIGKIVGEDWTRQPSAAGTWTQNDVLDYVLVDYWLDGYVSRLPNEWQAVPGSSSQWLVQ